MHTDREDLERLAERLADRSTPTRRSVEGSTLTKIVSDGPDATDASPEQLSAQRDRSRLPRVYLDARRRLRERLEASSASTTEVQP